MRTAEPSPTLAPERSPRQSVSRVRSSRRWAWSGLAVVLLAGLGLRLWGVKQGLPYAYNTDEADHFVPHAVRMFAEGTLNPHYFGNPPAYTYLLHYLLAVWYGGAAGARAAFALHPSQVYTLARVAAGLLGTAALWLLYATGARLFGRGIGLLAAAIEAVAFLPVFYSHLALNDVPTLAPLTVSLLGSAGVLQNGRRRHYVIAGIGLGLGCASKYTAGIVVLPLAAAVAVRYRDAAPGRRARVIAAALLAAAAAVIAFVAANPYAVLDFHGFQRELVHQSTLSSEAQGKLGAPRHGGIAYYLWSLTWGLGWLPALAALGGAVTIWRSRPPLGWLLVPAPLAFLVFMGLQGRYFGRWLMPILPILSLLAAFLIVQLAGALAGVAARWPPGARSAEHGGPRAGWGASTRTPLVRTVLVGVLAAAALAQGLVHSIHSGLVLSRPDTRNLTRTWMLEHVPAGARIVAEPVSPNEWARQVRPGTSTARNPDQWMKYPSLVSRTSASGALTDALRQVSIEEYERTLSPALLGYYTAHAYCWVLSGSTQSGRAFADPAAVPQAVAYYRALARQGEVVFRSSPYARGNPPVSFGFDWSFDYYPLSYQRPGPQITIYRLHGGRCPR